MEKNFELEKQEFLKQTEGIYPFGEFEKRLLTGFLYFRNKESEGSYHFLPAQDTAKDTIPISFSEFYITRNAELGYYDYLKEYPNISYKRSFSETLLSKEEKVRREKEIKMLKKFMRKSLFVFSALSHRLSVPFEFFEKELPLSELGKVDFNTNHPYINLPYFPVLCNLLSRAVVPEDFLDKQIERPFTANDAKNFSTPVRKELIKKIIKEMEKLNEAGEEINAVISCNLSIYISVHDFSLSHHLAEEILDTPFLPSEIFLTLSRNKTVEEDIREKAFEKCNNISVSFVPENCVKSVYSVFADTYFEVICSPSFDADKDRIDSMTACQFCNQFDEFLSNNPLPYSCVKDFFLRFQYLGDKANTKDFIRFTKKIVTSGINNSSVSFSPASSLKILVDSVLKSSSFSSMSSKEKNGIYLNFFNSSSLNKNNSDSRTRNRILNDITKNIVNDRVPVKIEEETAKNIVDFFSDSAYCLKEFIKLCDSKDKNDENVIASAILKCPNVYNETLEYLIKEDLRNTTCHFKTFLKLKAEMSAYGESDVLLSSLQDMFYGVCLRRFSVNSSVRKDYSYYGSSFNCNNIISENSLFDLLKGFSEEHYDFRETANLEEIKEKINEFMTDAFSDKKHYKSPVIFPDQVSFYSKEAPLYFYNALIDYRSDIKKYFSGNSSLNALYKNSDTGYRYIPKIFTINYADIKDLDKNNIPVKNYLFSFLEKDTEKRTNEIVENAYNGKTPLFTPLIHNLLSTYNLQSVYEQTEEKEKENEIQEPNKKEKIMPER